MPQSAYEKRLVRAKRKARSDLENDGWRVIVSDNNPVCLAAFDPQTGRYRLVRVCLDEVRREDRQAVACLKPLPVEIWIRKPRSEAFERRKI